MSRRRTPLAVVTAMTLALALGACGETTDHVAQATAAMPDLSQRGYESIDCADGVVLGMVYEPIEDERFEAQCWRGTPERPFFDEATFMVQSILTDTEGQAFTDQVCPQDVLTETAGVACRAVLFGSTDQGAMLGITVTLTDPATATSGLGDQPTAVQLEQALSGAEVEILIGTDGIEPVEPD